MLDDTHNWICLTHNSPQWDAARALGAQSECGPLPLTSNQRKHLAMWPFINENTARILAKDPDQDVRVLLANNPACPSRVLGLLVFTGFHGVRQRVVTHPDMPNDILHEAAQWLAEHRGATTRTADMEHIASHPNSSASTLRFIAELPPTYSRGRPAVAKNPNTPFDLLEKLADDPEPLVAASVMENPRVSVELVSQMAKSENKHLRAAAAASLRATPQILAQLATDEESNVRREVANNPFCPSEVLRQLAHDPDDWTVGPAARAHPACPPELREA